MFVGGPDEKMALGRDVGTNFSRGSTAIFGQDVLIIEATRSHSDTPH